VRAPQVVAALALVAAVAAGCSSDEPTTAPQGGAPDPCGLADPARVAPLLDGDAGTPVSSNEMSGDGAGPVLTCTFATDDGSKAVTYVQRLGMGREKFESSRDATAGAVAVGDDGYWVPSSTRLLVMDGDDLVAVLFSGVDVDLPTAEALLDDATARR
jgi:hypothetical protein